jgi:hypothetical protein
MIGLVKRGHQKMAILQVIMIFYYLLMQIVIMKKIAFSQQLLI